MGHVPKLLKDIVNSQCGYTRQHWNLAVLRSPVTISTAPTVGTGRQQAGWGGPSGLEASGKGSCAVKAVPYWEGSPFSLWPPGGRVKGVQTTEIVVWQATHSRDEAWSDGESSEGLASSSLCPHTGQDEFHFLDLSDGGFTRCCVLSWRNSLSSWERNTAFPVCLLQHTTCF